NQLGASAEIDRQYEAAAEDLTKITHELVAARVGHAEDDDLFAHLLQVHSADGAQLNEELRTFILAGHVTSTNVLAAAFTLLAQNPAVEEKLHAEIAEVIGERAPAFEDIVRLPFCEKVVRETLRLFPPVWILGREVAEEVNWGGYTLPVDAKLIISPWMFHHDARFFDAPESFRPERWNDAVPKFAFIPFSTGPRSCIGERFAMMEITLLLAAIARRWKFRELSPPYDARWSPQIIYWPRRGVSLAATRR
ncbi:MAG TPA: cytochrome P450, partial [Chthoniobacterales bacterium]